MEEVLRALTTGKMHELLVLFGIGECSDEPNKHHILASNLFKHLIAAWEALSALQGSRWK